MIYQQKYKNITMNINLKKSHEGSIKTMDLEEIFQVSEVRKLRDSTGNFGRLLNFIARSRYCEIYFIKGGDSEVSTPDRWSILLATIKLREIAFTNFLQLEPFCWVPVYKVRDIDELDGFDVLGESDK